MGRLQATTTAQLAAAQAALATLQSGDLAAAIAYLKADLVNNGHNREVAALLGLLESQLEKGLPFRPLPETDK